MSDYKKKTYVKGSAKEKIFSEGGQLINIDLNFEELSKLPRTESGYVKLTLSRNKTPDKFGNTHAMYLNEFVPDPNKVKSGAIGGGGPKEANKPYANKYGKPASTDDLPFRKSNDTELI